MVKLQSLILEITAIIAGCVSLGLFLQHRAMLASATNMRYYKLLPNFGHKFSPQPGNSPAESFLRSLPRHLGMRLVPPWFRFLAVVQDGVASFYLGLPSKAGREAAALFRRAFPDVSLIPVSASEVQKMLPWDNPSARGVRFKLTGPSPLPLATDRGAAAFEAVLFALGAGRGSDDVGMLDVLFTPVSEARFLARPGRKMDTALIERAFGDQARRGASLAGSLLEEINEEAFGGRMKPAASAGAGMSSLSLLRMMHRPEREEIEAVQQKYRPPQRAWRVSVRVAAAGPEAADAIRAAAGGIDGLSRYNRLAPEFDPYQRRSLRFIKDGILQPGEGSILCTSELAQLVLVPGEESPLWERGMERAPTRTVAPPREMLAADEEDGGYINF